MTDPKVMIKSAGKGRNDSMQHAMMQLCHEFLALSCISVFDNVNVHKLMLLLLKVSANTGG